MIAYQFNALVEMEQAEAVWPGTFYVTFDAATL